MNERPFSFHNCTRELDSWWPISTQQVVTRQTQEGEFGRVECAFGGPFYPASGFLAKLSKVSLNPNSCQNWPPKSTFHDTNLEAQHHVSSHGNCYIVSSSNGFYVPICYVRSHPS